MKRWLLAMIVSSCVLSWQVPAAAALECGTPGYGSALLRNSVALPHDEKSTDDPKLGMYVVHVPSNWNGVLLDWTSGGIDLFTPYFGIQSPEALEAARSWNTIAQRVTTPTYDAAILASPHVLPLENNTAVIPQGIYPDPPYDIQVQMRAAMETEGYAVAVAYGTKEQAEGLHGTFVDRVDLARDLIKQFRRRIAVPCRTLSLGESGGGFVSPKLAERYPNLVDGALGVHLTSDYMEAHEQFMATAFLVDVLFGWPAEWGTPEDPIQPDYFGSVLPTVIGWLSDPANQGKLEFLRYFRGFDDAATWYDSIWGVAANIANGILFDLALHEEYGDALDLSRFDYTHMLTPSQEAEIEIIYGIPVAETLAAVQARTSAVVGNHHAKHAARRDLRADPDKLTIPVIKIVQMSSGLETEELMAHEAKLFHDAGRDSVYLALRHGPPYNHGSSTIPEWLDAIHALEDWVSTGVKPGAGSFPAGHGWQGVVEPANPRWIP